MGVALVLLWLALVVGLALAARRRWPGQPEWSRKVLHIGTGPVVLIAWAVAVDRRLALAAATLVTLLAALNHRYRLLPAIEDVGRHSYGTVAYGAAITALLALFWPSQPQALVAGVLVMAWGDGLAGLLGPSIPSPSWLILGQRKSVVGTAAMAGTALVVLLLLRLLGGAGPGPGALVLISLAATMLEQIAVLGLDNLTVPVATGLLWNWLSFRP
ncbi:dolichol kinase [Synechococcus sp. BSF8S]|uniref:diacylglycerol/polyprenol kinase family protein n=1 Tax=Synechococcales TaxID=1890424 RepID=UPI001627FAC3|nr:MULTISPECIES: dolichol kinase [unclassified Synechococcus]MBC1260421.1 dolichol kinase [Synechococcus sp. BSF8S]MBC1263792.1 dolichol kinase [Synechococcus sp. BSA11S]